MGRLIKMVGRVWPAGLVSTLSERSYDMLNVYRTLDTGGSVRMRSNSDVIAFTDIFRRGEYDQAIGHAVRSHDTDPLYVLDLGADSGFFLQRLLDRMRAVDSRRDLTAFSVEGSPRNFARLQANFSAMSLPPGAKVEIVHGLVGLKSGVGLMRERVFNAMNRVDESGRPVRYVDVSGLVAGWPRIDLVKCDIEGSEGDFLRTYPDVLAKTQAAVFEFHDVSTPLAAECRRRLIDYGLTHTMHLRAFADNTVEFFWR